MSKRMSNQDRAIPASWPRGHSCAAMGLAAVFALTLAGCGGAPLRDEPEAVTEISPEETPTELESVTETPGQEESKPGETPGPGPVAGEPSQPLTESAPEEGQAEPSPEIVQDATADESLRRERERQVQRLVIQAQLQIDNGKLADAIATYEQAAELAPDSVFVLLRLGQAYLDATDPAKALDIANRAVALAADDPGAYGLKAQALAYLGQFDEALAEARQEVRLNPNSAGGYTRVAEIASRLGDNETVIDALQRLTYLDGQNAVRYRFSLGGIFASEGRFDEAVEAYEQVLEQFPNAVETLENIADIYRRMGRPEEAIESYRKALERGNLQENSERNIRFRLAELLRERHAYADAYAEYQRIREANPREPRAWSAQIEILIEQKQYEKAIDEIRQYLSKYPFDIQVALLNPTCQLHLKRQDEAARAILSVIDTLLGAEKAGPVEYAMVGERLLRDGLIEVMVDTGMDAQLGERLLQIQNSTPEALLIPASLLDLERRLDRQSAESAQIRILAERLCATMRPEADDERKTLRARESLLVVNYLMENPDVLAGTLLFQPGDNVKPQDWDFWFERLALLVHERDVADAIMALPSAGAVRARMEERLAALPDSLAIRIAIMSVTPEEDRGIQCQALLSWLNDKIREGDRDRTERAVTTILSGDLFPLFTSDEQHQFLLLTLAQAEAEFPDSGLYGYAQGLVYAARKDTPAAAAKLESVVATLPVDNPWYKPAQKRLAWVYDRSGQLEKAEELLLRLLAIDTTDPEVHRHLVMVYDKLDRLEELEEHANRVIALLPEDPESYNMLGYTYASRDIKLDKALELVERALEMAPDDGNIMDSLGWVYFRMGLYDRAVETLERAMELVGEDHPVILDHLGDAYAKTGRKEEAASFWRRALEAGPDYPYDFTDKFQHDVREKIESAG